MDESYFPIEVVINDKETKIFEDPDDIPPGVTFRVLRTRVPLDLEEIRCS